MILLVALAGTLALIGICYLLGFIAPPTFKDADEATAILTHCGHNVTAILGLSANGRYGIFTKEGGTFLAKKMGDKAAVRSISMDNLVAPLGKDFGGSLADLGFEAALLNPAKSVQKTSQKGGKND